MSCQARRQRRGRGGNAPPIFVFAPPDLFLAPHGIFWEEKVAGFGRKKRLNLRFRPEKAFRFRRRPFFFEDHLFLVGKNF